MITIGDNTIGTSVPASGRIRNLDLRQSGPTGLAASFVHEGAGDDHQALTYVNGTLASIDNDELAATSGLPEGSVNVNVVPALAYEPYSTLFFDENDGNRVLMTWPASTSAIAGYRIYNYPAMTERDTVTDHKAQALNLAYPSSGTGTGRVSASPVFVETDIRGTLKLIIDGAGSYHFDLEGVAEASDTFAQGTIAFYAGIPFVFEDPAEAYQVGDEFHCFVGVQPQWLSDELAPGEYQFAVKAYDAYGQESTAVVSQLYEILLQADEAEPVESWDSVSNTLFIDFLLPDGAVSVNLYTNFEPQEGEFTEYVSLNPVANHTGSTPYVDPVDLITKPTPETAFSIDFGTAEGELKYYLRPVTPDGVELQDFTLRTAQIPTPEEVVGQPLRLAVDALGVLNWFASWSYYFQDNDALASFTVHRVPAAGSFTYDLADTVATIAAAAEGSGYEEEFSYTETAESEPAGVLKIQVVARSAAGTVAFSDIVEITTQAAAVIAPPGAILGGTA